jgi:hypothetical protein
MDALIPWIQLAGVVLVLIAAANIVVPRRLGYRENLARLSPIVRQVFVLHSIYMVMVVLGFAGLCLFFARELAGASSLGHALSWFLAVFWLSRVAMQVVFVDAETRRANPVGNAAYTLATAALGGVFAIAAIGGGR